jgi:hypothetical protein
MSGPSAVCAPTARLVSCQRQGNDAEMPSVVRQTLVGREGARFPSSRRQCHGLSLRESWVESGRRKLLFFSRYLNFAQGLLICNVRVLFARFQVLQRQFWISCKAIACCSGGGQDGQKILSNTNPQDPRLPKRLGLQPKTTWVYSQGVAVARSSRGLAVCRHVASLWSSRDGGIPQGLICTVSGHLGDFDT